METTLNKVKVIGALIAGSLIGSAFGVLFAPAKGSKTRCKLVGGSKDLAEDITSRMRDEATVLRCKAEELESLALKHEISD